MPIGYPGGPVLVLYEAIYKAEFPAYPDPP